MINKKKVIYCTWGVKTCPDTLKAVNKKIWDTNLVHIKVEEKIYNGSGQLSSLVIFCANINEIMFNFYLIINVLII